MSYDEDYRKNLRMGEFSCPNTAVLVWRPRSVVVDVPAPTQPTPYNADRWILWSVLGACVVGLGIMALAWGSL